LTNHEVLVNKKPNNIGVLERNGNSFLVKVNDKSVQVKVINNLPEKIIMEINGQLFQAERRRIQGGVYQIKVGGKIFEVQYPIIKTFKEPVVKPALSVAAVAKSTAASLKIERDAVIAPIAGRVVLVKVNVGQKVERGDCICILEAMKMENEVAAPKAGVVKEILVSDGKVVNKGDVLAIIA
jgi:biotin carboxyl carrier protein